MRLRLTFSKTPAMRFTGHMDLHRSLERTFRRARLPLTHSQGFTKRPKINIATALPLGVTGEKELADIWLDETMPLQEVVIRVRESSPPGIALHTVETIPEDAPKLQNIVTSSDFIVTLLDPIADLEDRIIDLLEAETLPRVRRKKPYDLRPLVYELRRIENDEDGCQRLAMKLSTRDSATGRPDEVVAQLGGEPLDTRIHRVRIYLGSNNNQ